MTLFGYIYDLAAKSVNDNKSKNWLPSVLERATNPDTGEKILPFTVGSFDMGDITEGCGVIQQAFCDSWWNLTCNSGRKIPEFDSDDFHAIPCPGKSYPRLTFRNMIIKGLNNVRLMDEAAHKQTADGYDAVLTAEFNVYALEKVRISGDFTLTQAVCAADEGDFSGPTKRQFNFPGLIGWPEKNIVVNGTMDLYVTDLFLDVGTLLQIKDSGANRALSATARSIELYGRDKATTPTWSIDEKTFRVDSDLNPYYLDVIITAALTALRHPDTQACMTDLFNKALRQQLSVMSQYIGEFVANFFDDVLGSVEEGKLPLPKESLGNVADQYIFDRARYSLSSDKGKFYLPIFMATLDGVTEPYKMDRISLPSFDVMGLTFTDVELKNISILGLTNISLEAPNIYVKDQKLYMKADLSKLNPPPVVKGAVIPPPPLQMDGIFSATAQNVRFTGKLYVTMLGSSIALVSRFSAEKEGLTIVHEGLNIGLNTLADLAVKLEMDSIFTQFLNQFLNKSDDIKKKIVSGVNDSLRGYLPDLSRETTQKVREMIAKYMK